MQRFFALFVLGMFGLMIWLAVAWNRSFDKRAEPCSGADRSGAYAAAQQLITRRLAAPATAVYPSIIGEGVRVDEIAPCRFRVQTYVDAQNGFGALVRTPYTLDLTYLEADRIWTDQRVEAAKPHLPAANSASPKERPLPDR